MKRLRILLLLSVTAILAAVVSDYLVSRRSARELALDEPEALPSNLDSKSRRWSWSQSSADRPKVELHAETAQVVRDSPLLQLEGVELNIFGEKEQTFDRILCKAAQFDGETMYSEGEVIVLLDLPADRPDDPSVKPTTIRSTGVTFQSKSGTCSTDRFTEYEFDGGVGHSMGAFYDSVHRYFRMKSDAYLERFAATSGAPPLKISAGELFYYEIEQRVDLKAGATLERGSRGLRAAQASVYLDEGVIRRIVATEASGLEKQEGRLVRFETPRLEAWYTPQQTLERLSGLERSELTSETDSSATRVTGERVDLFYVIPAGADDSVLHEARVRGDGRIAVRSRPEGTEASAETRLVSADQLRLAMREGGKDISELETLTRGRLELLPEVPAHPKRILEAERLKAFYAPGNRMEKLQAMGDVSLESHPPREPPAAGEQQQVLRTWSDGLLADFDGDSGDMLQLKQWAHFRFERGGRRGQAGEAQFDLAANRTELTGKARVWDPSGSTSAHHLILDENSGDFVAENGVASEYLERDAAGSKPAPEDSLFSASEPVFASADRMVSNQQAGLLDYRGRARLWQGANRVEADHIEIQRKAKTLTAKGRVVSFLVEQEAGAPGPPAAAGSATAAQPALTEIRADSMHYDEATRRVIYRGRVELKREHLRVKSDELEAFLEPAGEGQTQARLHQAIARRQVEIIEQETVASLGRRAFGQRAEYFPSSGKVIVNGEPARVISQQHDEARGTELTYHINDDRLLVSGGTERAYTYRRQRHP